MGVIEIVGAMMGRTEETEKGETWIPIGKVVGKMVKNREMVGAKRDRRMTNEEMTIRLRNGREGGSGDRVSWSPCCQDLQDWVGCSITTSVNRRK